MIKIWFHEFYTEAHKTPEAGEALVSALERHGIQCSKALTSDCQAAFCGGFIKSQDFLREYAAADLRIPKFHYNWDLYPFQINGNPDYPYTSWWKEYVEELKTAAEIWVPSRCTIARTIEFTGRSAIVIKSSVRPYAVPAEDKGYVLDPMRKYEDSNCNLVRTTCEKLGIPCIETLNSQPWEVFKATVAGARLIVSAQHEASTGSLTLLEGYALGKPLLLSNSPRHGGVDYLGDRAAYFQWDNPEDFQQKLSELYHNPPQLNQQECWDWVTSEYSEDRMAREMAQRIRTVLPNVR